MEAPTSSGYEFTSCQFIPQAGRGGVGEEGEGSEDSAKVQVSPHLPLGDADSEGAALEQLGGDKLASKAYAEPSSTRMPCQLCSERE